METIAAVRLAGLLIFSFELTCFLYFGERGTASGGGFLCLQ
jgi:hypothetical protein